MRLRPWTLLPALFGIGVLVNAGEGKWVFTETATGAGFVALDVVIGVALIAGSLAWWWRVARRPRLAIAMPGAGPGRSLSAGRFPRLRAVDFQTDAQREFYEKAKGWVRQLYGESAWVSDEAPQFGVPVGGFNVAVGIESLGDDDACADIWTWPVSEEARATDGTLRYMLEKNAKFRFGALNIQGNGVIVFEYTAPATLLTKERFDGLLWAVAGAAAEIQKELQPMLSA